MTVNLRPYSNSSPLEISREDYDRLARQKGPDGWSSCAGETEWLAKLHYLRTGWRASNMEREQFEQREFNLVYEWLKRHFD